MPTDWNKFDIEEMTNSFQIVVQKPEKKTNHLAGST